MVNVYEGEEERYFTFLSEESSKWLDSYHNMRQKAGEILTSNSPLFREEFDIEKAEVVANPTKCSEGMLKTFMSRAAISAGVKPMMRVGTDIESEPGAYRHEWKNVHGYRMILVLFKYRKKRESEDRLSGI